MHFKMIQLGALPLLHKIISCISDSTLLWPAEELLLQLLTESEEAVALWKELNGFSLLRNLVSSPEARLREVCDGGHFLIPFRMP